MPAAPWRRRAAPTPRCWNGCWDRPISPPRRRSRWTATPSTPPRSRDCRPPTAPRRRPPSPPGRERAPATAAGGVARAGDWRREPRARWLVTGGGGHTRSLMGLLAAGLGVPVEPVESVGWDGDALEAQAFGYLAVRSRLGLPLSLPGTTGVPQPVAGGRFSAP